MTLLAAIWLSMVFTGGITHEIYAPKVKPFHSVIRPEKKEVKKSLRYRLDSY